MKSSVYLSRFDQTIIGDLKSMFAKNATILPKKRIGCHTSNPCCNPKSIDDDCCNRSRDKPRND
jgi:hypothetical protein